MVEKQNNGGLALSQADVSSPEEERQVALDRVLDLVDARSSSAVSPAVRTPLALGMSAGRILGVDAQGVLLESWDGQTRFVAQPAPFFDPALLEEAQRDGRLAVVDARPSGVTLIGLLQTAPLAVSRLRGQDVEIEATNELVLRSGRAALRLRADGTVELVGTRISAVSRGVLRLLGRALRLN